jgi:hypothetical protein
MVTKKLGEAAMAASEIAAAKPNTASVPSLRKRARGQMSGLEFIMVSAYFSFFMRFLLQKYFF